MVACTPLWDKQAARECKLMAPTTIRELPHAHAWGISQLSFKTTVLWLGRSFLQLVPISRYVPKSAAKKMTSPQALTPNIRSLRRLGSISFPLFLGHNWDQGLHHFLIMVMQLRVTVEQVAAKALTVTVTLVVVEPSMAVALHQQGNARPPFLRRKRKKRKMHRIQWPFFS